LYCTALLVYGQLDQAYYVVVADHAAVESPDEWVVLGFNARAWVYGERLSEIAGLLASMMGDGHELLDRCRVAFVSRRTLGDLQWGWEAIGLTGSNEWWLSSSLMNGNKKAVADITWILKTLGD